MNKEISQLCQKINYQDILDKRFYPVWFFTNERINYFFCEIENNRTIKNVFSVGGGGDFAFSLLSTQILDIDELNICDIRQMACISIDFKIGLLKNLKYEEFLNLFLRRISFHKKQTYKRIRETITPLSKKIIESVIENCKKDDFLKCLRKSGLWYRDSFWQIKNRKEYLPYLISEEKYNCLQKNLDKITIYAGDFNENLQRFKSNYFDLIYVSNILDSKKYCPETNLYLQSIKDKLGSNGLLFAVAQNNPKKMIKLIQQNGFSLKQKQIHRFNIISSIFGHYDYSFLLFAKE
jgi:hypothetical protein